ncbi:MAG: hypothetical protein WBV82_11440 [Myxococcaceae bacterium]
MTVSLTVLITSVFLAATPPVPSGGYVLDDYLRQLDCLESPNEICALEQHSRGRRLTFNGSWALWTPSIGSGMGGVYLVRFDQVEGLRWRGRRAFCEFEECPCGQMPTGEALRHLEETLEFEEEPVYAWLDSGVLYVRWIEPAERELEDGDSFGVELWRYAPAEAFARKLSAAKATYAPSDCRDAPAGPLFVFPRPSGGACLVGR